MSGNANNSPKPPPLIKAAGLWQKSSVKGGQYLTGRMGGVKVLILENRDRQSDDDPSHHLFFVEAPDRRQGGQQAAQERSGGPGGTPDRPEAIRGAAQELPGAGAARPRRCTGVGAMSVTKRKKSNQPVPEPSAKSYEPTDQERAAAKAHLARRAARTTAPRVKLEPLPSGGRLH